MEEVPMDFTPMEEVVMETVFQTTRSWFSYNPMRSMFAPNEIITTEQPTPSRWRIIKAIRERDQQRKYEERDANSPPFASLRLSCCSLGRAGDETDDVLSACFSMADVSLDQQSSDSMDPNDDRVQRRAEMRVYLQVPAVGTEYDPPEIRAQQATTFDPPELQAYKALSSDYWVSTFTPGLLGYEKGVQDEHGLVPGGFYTIIVWEYVPGTPLGTGCWNDNNCLYWSFPPEKRDRIMSELLSMTGTLYHADVNVLPDPMAMTNLIWNEETEKLYLVGFRNWIVLGGSAEVARWKYLKLPWQIGLVNRDIPELEYPGRDRWM